MSEVFVITDDEGRSFLKFESYNTARRVTAIKATHYTRQLDAIRRVARGMPYVSGMGEPELFGSRLRIFKLELKVVSQEPTD